LLPEESGEIKVTFNSKNKIGRIRKTITIYSNDKSQPVKKIFIYAQVVPKTKNDPHADENMMHGSYFEGKCANCHVERGIGKYGKALYDADCAMCHGANGKGVEHLTRPLNDQKYLSSILDEELYKRIANGTSNIMMQGFAKEKSGPLDEKQLRSVSEYIRSFQKVQKE